MKRISIDSLKGAFIHNKSFKDALLKGNVTLEKRAYNNPIYDGIYLTTGSFSVFVCKIKADELKKTEYVFKITNKSILIYSILLPLNWA